MIVKEIPRAESFKTKKHQTLQYTELIKKDFNSDQVVNEDSILLCFGGNVLDVMEFTTSFESLKKVFIIYLFNLNKFEIWFIF